MSEVSRPGRGRLRAFFASWLLLSLMSVIWSIATPLGGSPDEPAHAIKAASIVRGELAGPSSKNGTIVQVPAYVAYVYNQTCYAFHSDVTAACSTTPITGDPGRTVTSATTAGLYNPLYYALVGWPTLLAHDDSGVYWMRVISGIVSSLFLAFTFMMLFSWRRRLLVLLGFAVATTPMVLFLNGSINPNSVEVSATLAAFVGVMTILRQPDPARLTQHAVIVTISAVIAVNARGISPLWVAIALLTPFALSTWPQIRSLARERVVQVAVGCIALATIAALLWTKLSGSLETTNAGTGEAATGYGVGSSPLVGFAQIFVGTFDYGQGMIGDFGWLDTPAPSAVFFAWSAFIGALCLLCLMLLRGRPFILAVGLMAGLLFIPPIVQAAYITGGGIIWQGRYALPLFVCVVVALCALLGERLPRLDRRAEVWLCLVTLSTWAAAQMLAFVYALKRYGVGATSSSWRKLLLAPDWAPPGGIALTLVLCIIIFAGGAALLSVMLLKGRSSLRSDLSVQTPAG